MYPDLFDLSFWDYVLSITSYRFFGVLGAIFFLFYYLRILQHYGLSITARIISAVIIALSFLIGSRLLYSILSIERVLDDPELLYSLKLINFSLFGGLALSLFTWWLVSKRYQLPFLKLTDKFVVPAAISLILFRTGCFLNGCCFGKSTDIPWGVTFPRGSMPHLAQMTSNPFSFFTSIKAVHPTQLYEIGGLLISVLAAWMLWKKNKLPGLMAAVFVLFYTITRLINHFLRYYPESVQPLHMLQAPFMYTLIIVTFSVFMYFLCKKT